VLRKHFIAARSAAVSKYPDLAGQIQAFWFYDIRAKAADDKAEEINEQAASELLGHESTKTTRRHYLRRGKKVMPTK
jgi:integrase